MKILRATPDLAEVAFVDQTSSPLRHEHHLIMRRGKPGLYGYDILTAVTATSISEVRMNARWDRSIFDHAFIGNAGEGSSRLTPISPRRRTSATKPGNRRDQ